MNLRLAFVLTLLSVWTEVPAECWAQQPAAVQPEPAAYVRGKSLYESKRFAEAAAAFREAWAEVPSGKIAGLLALAEFHRGDCVEATRFLTFTLEHPPREMTSKSQRMFEKALAECRPKVAAVTVKVPDGFVVSVDGQAVGTAPLEPPLFVAPGPRVIEVRRDDRSGRQLLEATAGGEHLVEPVVSAPAPAAVVPVPPEPVTEGPAIDSPAPIREARENEKTVVVLSGAGATLIALGIGAGFALAGGAAGEEVDEARRAVSARFPEGAGCSNPAGRGSADCRALNDAIDRRNARNGIANVAFISGAVLGAATLGAFLLWPESRTEATSARLAPVFDRDGAGLILDARF